MERNGNSFRKVDANGNKKE